MVKTQNETTNVKMKGVSIDSLKPEYPYFYFT